MMDEDGHSILIDYGLCKKYRNQSGAHISEKDTLENFRGSILFGSPHTLGGGKASRRDDLFSLVYLLIFRRNNDTMPF